MTETLNLLFFGDIVGKSGRRAVRQYLLENRKPGDIIIANAENVTHGFGLKKSHYQELVDSGIDILTGGNHTWDQKEILDYIQDTDNMLRPANMPGHLPGVGARVVTVNGHKIGVINLIGQVFMGNYNSPWDIVDNLLASLKAQTPIVFLDFHAEVTAEKNALAYYLSQHGVSAMVGTHTHVQTADERILHNQMGYLTDAGFNGAYHSIIGMTPGPSLQRLKDHLPSRLEVCESDTVQVNAVRFTIDAQTGTCLAVLRINEVLTLSEHHS